MTLHRDAIDFIIEKGLLFPGSKIDEHILREIVLRCTGGWDTRAFDMRGSKDVPMDPAFDGSPYRMEGILIPYENSMVGRRLLMDASEAKIDHMFACEGLRMLLMPLSASIGTTAKNQARRLISMAGYTDLDREEISRVGAHVKSDDAIDAVIEAAKIVRKEVRSEKLARYFFVAPHHGEIVARIPAMVSLINLLLSKVDAGETHSTETIARFQEMVHSAIIRNRPYNTANGRLARLLTNILGWRARRERGLILLTSMTRKGVYVRYVSGDLEEGGHKKYLVNFFIRILEKNMETL